MADTVMAKKKHAAASEPELKTVALRTSRAWAEWLERAAEHNRTGVAAFIDQAVEAYAKARGFDEDPPKRLPKSPR